MSEITHLVTTYCQQYKNKENLRQQCSEATKEFKTTGEKLTDEMTQADLRIIRSMSAGFDIKLLQKTKKPTQSCKNLREKMQHHGVSDDKIDAIMKDITCGKEETSSIIRLIPLNKKKNDTTVLP